MKVSEDFESVAHEIKVLKLVKNAVTDQDKYFPFPSLKSYGTFIASNLHESDIKETNQDNMDQKQLASLFAFYVMPKMKESL